ncbi:hypothetical protein DB88DRAFT_18512 [Papiliotrema laurentii]|uniref:Uncharacterized protein n=1 Tax=Papiliotrema laurentii TaxID=5418 RepID=A0AAD9L8I2_PAPLA|nr:hypothetical protein DB88DRAFT_18512 [Papiliotrema laurentii]
MASIPPHSAIYSGSIITTTPTTVTTTTTTTTTNSPNNHALPNPHQHSSTVPEHVGPIRAFFREVPMPPEAYPLAGLVVSMIGWATYHSAKHIREDRDHLRWYPGAGNFEYFGYRFENNKLQKCTGALYNV